MIITVEDVTYMFARVTSRSRRLTFCALDEVVRSTSNLGSLITDPAYNQVKVWDNNLYQRIDGWDGME